MKDNYLNDPFFFANTVKLKHVAIKSIYFT